MPMTIALAGNPNCGKTTMFNALTGANQYVGNWPGVTVERKEGRLKKNKEIRVVDLPGIYSLSPYTPEEVVSRDYLASAAPDAILNIVDATNIERNLYLTTQLLELGKPTVVALNLMDAFQKSGDCIDVKKLSEKLGVAIVETSALYGKGVLEAAEKAATSDAKIPTAPRFADDVEGVIAEVERILLGKVDAHLQRWFAIKFIERDKNVQSRLALADSDKAKIEASVQALEKNRNDDSESIITNERYHFIAEILRGVFQKSNCRWTFSDKVDRIVTNRILGIPIFLLTMWAVYYIAVSTIGSMGTDWVNDSLIPGIQDGVAGWLSNAGASPILLDALVNGVIGGVGAVVGFAPQMFILFILLSFIEDCGYMARIAFVMDRVFRRFGLSGKSFIPLLVSSGCGIPGIMASKTIENENDRRLTIMTTTWVPCGAKIPVMACMTGVIAASCGFGSWVAPSVYFICIGSVLLAAIMLKKTKYFYGESAPFVLELPQYHLPQAKTVLLHAWERTRGFLIKAGTILFLACLAMWFLSSYGWESPSVEVAQETLVEESTEDSDAASEVENEEAAAAGESLEADSDNLEFGLVENSANSILARVGDKIRYIFVPLGFGGKEGGWQAAASTIAGFSAKEGIVGTMAVLAGGNDALVESAEGAESFDAEDEGLNVFGQALKKWFPSALAAFCFLLFNLLNSPCLAAIATMAHELNHRKWFWFAFAFQNIWAWTFTFIIYQIGRFITDGRGFTIGTGIACCLLAVMLFLLFRPNPYKEKNFKTVRSVDAQSALENERRA
ncbi:ferrous iron transport protein B [uncultured Fibrobacter sp.]|uniref:ferrous iron transport protein B n=1 Tax=uncultured Fibrobacter sp. TaxID=261512 RepID=UPI0025983D0A|nr:ferrous iron transport protein B [uncultured Fibrobacter sp.]